MALNLIFKTLNPTPLLSLFLTLLVLPNKVRSQGDVTSFQYDTFEPNTEGLIYERDAFVPSGSSHLSLIGVDASGNPLRSSVGRVLYSTPVNLWDSRRAASFETTIRFLTRNYDNNPADGMTFFIVPVNSTEPTGGEGGSLGIFNAVVPGTPIFAVEFDIFCNAGLDPSFRHIGIDINSQGSAAVRSIEDSFNQVTTMRINYDARTGRIDVVVIYGSELREVSYVYDLKTLLPQQVQVGISASTGPTLVAGFDIYSWHFTSYYSDTSFEYNTFEPNTEGLIYERDAFVPSGSSHLSLIGADASGNPLRSSVGRVLYSTLVNLWDSGREASFETTIIYQIITYDNNPADGMTFFIVPINSTIATNGEGGNLGIFNAVAPNSPIFAIEFDIYVNQGNDPNFRHIGIDINSRRSANVTDFQGSLNQVTTVRINYDAPTSRIDVVTSYGSESSEVSYAYDLKTLLPQQVQVGISASTGPSLVADFNIYSWYFTSTLIAASTNTGAYIKQVV